MHSICSLQLAKVCVCVCDGTAKWHEILDAMYTQVSSTTLCNASDFRSGWSCSFRNKRSKRLDVLDKIWYYASVLKSGALLTQFMHKSGGLRRWKKAKTTVAKSKNRWMHLLSDKGYVRHRMHGWFFFVSVWDNSDGLTWLFAFLCFVPFHRNHCDRDGKLSVFDLMFIFNSIFCWSSKWNINKTLFKLNYIINVYGHFSYSRA